MSAHLCHAEGCDKNVPPKMLMCPKHWRMVPRVAQAAVWATYQPGQEVRKDPTREYLIAARDAINAVAEKEGRPTRPGLRALDEPKTMTTADECAAACAYGTCGGQPDPCGGCCRCQGGCLVAYENTLPAWDGVWTPAQEAFDAQVRANDDALFAALDRQERDDEA